MSSETRGLQLEPDLQLVPDDANDKPGSSVAFVTQGAPLAVRLPLPSNWVPASRQATRADGSGPEASRRQRADGHSRTSRPPRPDRLAGHGARITLA